MPINNLFNKCIKMSKTYKDDSRDKFEHLRKQRKAKHTLSKSDKYPKSYAKNIARDIDNYTKEDYEDNNSFKRMYGKLR